MKINNKYLNIPPHISTPWNNIKSLYMKGNTLVIILLNDEAVQIQQLEQSTIDEIFAIHANYLESEILSTPAVTKITTATFPLEFSLESFPEQMEAFTQLGINSFEELSSAMQHNSSLASSPDIPKEMLSRISSVIKALSPEELLTIAPAETACNCPHCQITRAIRGETPLSEIGQQTSIDEEILDAVDDSELHFQQWNIQEISNNLYSVINKLDSLESYNVYLGSPVGCTCGHSGCEHILAVLNS